MVNSIFKTEGKGLFDSRTAVFGHLQQGGTPSPLDRIRATRLAVRCVDWMEDVAFEQEAVTAEWAGASRVWTDKPEHACVVGIKGASLQFTPVEEVVKVCTTFILQRRRVTECRYEKEAPDACLVVGHAWSNPDIFKVRRLNRIL